MLFYCSFWFVLLLLFVKMSTHEEQRTNIKFLAKSGKNPTEVWRSLTAVYGNNALSYPQVCMWHKRFLQGRQSAKDDPRSRRLSTRLQCVQAVRDSVQGDQRKTLREISEEVNKPESTVSKVLRKDLNMRKLSAKFVPHLLTDGNKRMRVELCNQNLRNVREIPCYLDRIVSGDKLGYPCTIKRQSLNHANGLSEEEIDPPRWSCPIL